MTDSNHYARQLKDRIWDDSIGRRLLHCEIQRLIDYIKALKIILKDKSLKCKQRKWYKDELICYERQLDKRLKQEVLAL